MQMNLYLRAIGALNDSSFSLTGMLPRAMYQALSSAGRNKETQTQTMAASPSNANTGNNFAVDPPRQAPAAPVTVLKPEAKKIVGGKSECKQ